MDTILDKIVAQKRDDLQKRKQKLNFNDLHSLEGYEKKRINFKDALLSNKDVSIIAEVKKGSPSKGIIREDFNHLDTALRYQDGGAAAISVLTDEPFFMGSLEYLNDISKKVELPLLRKDFIIDPYQVKEAKAFGADAVLIIVAITDGNQLQELIHAAKEYELSALVECYDEADFDRIDFNEVDILGVNNRDLKHFKVDVHRGINLLNKAPKDTVLVSESGLSNGNDIALLHEHSIHAALIGEHFMRQPDPGHAVKELLTDAQKIIERN